MKTLTPIILALFVALSSFASFNPSEASANKEFHLKCTIKNSFKKLKHVKLYIYEDGKKIDVITAHNGKFKFSLPLDKEVMLEFNCDNYVSKRIAFNTNLEDENIDLPVFSMTLNLYQKDNLFMSEQDEDLLDFPVAYIAFDEEKQEFYDKNDSYSKVLAKEIDKSMESFSYNTE